MKNTKLKVLIILVILLIILFGILCAVTDIFRSPKTLFYKYLINGNIKNITDKNYDDFLAEIQDQSSYEISGNMNIKAESNANVNQFNMDYNILTDENKNKYINLKENSNDENSLNIELVQNNTVFGIKEKNIYDKYVSIDLSKAKETLEKMNLDSSEIGDAINYEKYLLYYISKEDRETIIDTYKNVIYKNIPDKKYSVEKNVNIDVNGNTYKCKAYKLKLTNEEYNNICTKLLEELKNDELTLNLIVEKYNMANFNIKDITKQELLKNIQKKQDMLNNSIDNTSDLEIVVYVSNAKTIRTEIIQDDGSIVIDATRTKKQLTTLVKVNKDSKKYEILGNFNKISDNNIESKIIYVQNNFSIKIDINTQISKAQTNIIQLNEKNSENISEKTEEDILNINNIIIRNLGNLIIKRTDNEGIRDSFGMIVEELNLSGGILTEETIEENNDGENEETANNEENTNSEQEENKNLEKNNVIENPVQNPVQ